jgi:hypothetical protein
MKASELRIGNYILTDDDQFVTVDNNVFRAFSFPESEKWYKPIPLTEEWLIKFGFNCHTVENEARTIFYSKNWGINGVEIICLDYHYKGIFEYQVAKARYKEVKYVHQLQNLYFALTGEELIITE